MARFQGNIHEGSNQLATLVILLALLVIIGLLVAYFNDPAAFQANWNNLVNTQ